MHYLFIDAVFRELVDNCSLDADALAQRRVNPDLLQTVRVNWHSVIVNWHSVTVNWHSVIVNRHSVTI